MAVIPTVGSGLRRRTIKVFINDDAGIPHTNIFLNILVKVMSSGPSQCE